MAAHPRLRRTAGAIVVGGLVATAVAVDRSPSPQHDPSPSSAVTEPGDVAEDVDEATSPYRPGRGLPATGPGFTEAGLAVAAVATTGGIEVVEWVLLPEPVDTLTLAPPEVADLGPLLAFGPAVVEDLSVDAGGRSASAPGELGTATRVDLARPAQAFELRYRLLGSTRTDAPTDGEALVGFGPLTTGVPDDLPVAVTVPGASVQDLACLDGEQLRQCAAGLPPLLHTDARLPLGLALVVARLAPLPDPTPGAAP